MKKEVFELLKKETQYISLIFILVLLVFKIAFYKEGYFVLFRNVLSIFWLFVLPGYFLMLYWSSKLDFIERLIIGISVSAGLTGILSYYIALFGLNIKYHAFMLPLVLILLGFLLAIKKKSD